MVRKRELPKVVGERIDLSDSERPRTKEGYYIQSTGDFTGFEEVEREGDSVIYRRTNSGSRSEGERN